MGAAEPDFAAEKVVRGWLLCEQDMYSLSCYNHIAIFYK